MCSCSGSLTGWARAGGWRKGPTWDQHIFIDIVLGIFVPAHHDTFCLGEQNILVELGINEQSMRYNPFKYIRCENDILKLVNCIMENSAP